ncbi:MAG: class A beta-lactamase-related serine hydrolase, partial [Chloroflexi bacterium]
MNKIITCCLLFCVCFALLILPHTTTRAQSESPFIEPAAIDSYVESERQAARIPGMAAAIVQGDGQVYLKGYGSAGPDGRPVTPQTPFLLGSVSKSFTALAVMQLVEAGKIDLDAPIQRYLPWLEFGSPGASSITARHLLHHTSGIPTYAGELAFVGQRSASLEELLRKQQKVALSASPGQKYQYSNLNYVALGALVEAVSGQAFGDYLRENIFAPLEMPHTSTAPGPDLSAGHQYFFGFPVQTQPPFRADNLPAGYILSSAEDMAHYLAMWLNGGQYKDTRLLSPAGIAALQQPEANVTGYTRYAMGWFTNPDGSVTWHNGSTLNYKAAMKILHKDRLGVVVLYNITDDLMSSLFGGGFMISEGIISLLYGEKPPAAGM